MLQQIRAGLVLKSIGHVLFLFEKPDFAKMLSVRHRKIHIGDLLGHGLSFRLNCIMVGNSNGNGKRHLYEMGH